MQGMAAKKSSGLTIRMDATTRARLDRLARARGLSTGALLLALGLEESYRTAGTAKLLRDLERMDAPRSRPAALACSPRTRR